MSATQKQQLAKLKLDAQIEHAKQKIVELKQKKVLITSAPKKAIAKKTKSATATKTATTPKEKKKRTKAPLKVHHVGPAAAGVVISQGDIEVEKGHHWIIHREGDGEVIVGKILHKGGVFQIVPKKEATTK